MGVLSSAYSRSANPYDVDNVPSHPLDGAPDLGAGMGSTVSTPPRPAPVYSSRQWEAYGGGPSSGQARPATTYSSSQWANYGGGNSPRDNGYGAALASNFNALMGANASQMAGFQNNVSQAQLGLQFQGALAGNSRNAAVNQFNQGIGELNLNRLGNAYQSTALNRDADYYANVYGNTYRQYLTDYDWTNQQEGFAGNDYNTNSGFLTAQQQAAAQRNDLANQGFGAQREDASMAQVGREQSMREALAVGGGGYTQGLRSDRQLSDYERTATDRDIGIAASLQRTNYGEQTAGFGRDRALLDNGWNRDKAGFTNARNNMNLDLERSNLNYEQQKGQIEDRFAELSLQAARFNLDEDAMRQNVETQLQRLGLENQMTTGQLLDAIRNGNAQQQQLAQQIFQQAAGMTKRK